MKANTQVVESRSQIWGEIRAEKLELRQSGRKQISESLYLLCCKQDAYRIPKLPDQKF